ncbi:hypothetical protein CDD83_10655 [Cordyceps sp. RAO-2017]|nr:hypothetical protein CDD83_10655 [Cordyceps sp. RAO-2017]
MSHLKWYAYEGQGVNFKKLYSFSQATRIGDTIECSGQGGWDPMTGEYHSSDPIEQIKQAFANVEICLKDAGGKGWSQVYKVRSYHVDINEAVVQAMVDQFKKYMPNHQPLWTCLGVAGLGAPEMKAEIEVIAHDPEGAKIHVASD